MAYGKMTIEDSALNQIAISLPEFGYTTEISYPWDIQKDDESQYNIYDHGLGLQLYDKRKCRLLAYLTTAQMSVLNTMLGHNTMVLGRAYNLTLRMDANSGFFPFGPDKGDVGDFEVGIIFTSHGRVGDRPFRLFKIELDIQQTGAYPSYTPPADINEGSFNYGSVSNCRFPPNWFSPKVKYAYDRATTQGSDIEWIDKGSEGDGYESAFSFSAGPQKAAALIDYISTIRTTNFQATPPALSYMFGEDKGSTGNYIVKNISNKIKITCVRKSLFTWPMKLSYVSG